jgi:CubicO group peptidase (beta-lactamase class C family)
VSHAGNDVRPLDQFDALVAEVMAEWQIPGLAMAVIRAAAATMLGLARHRGRGAGWARDNLFPICSVTKSFTATGLALLVDEGKLDWDTRVREILPEFRLRDPVASEQATLRDLLTHRTGVPRHDWVHMGGHLDNAGRAAPSRTQQAVPHLLGVGISGAAKVPVPWICAGL